MKAYILQCYFRAGLQLVGQEDDGELMFLGTKTQWRNANSLVNYFETFVI